MFRAAFSDVLPAPVFPHPVINRDRLTAMKKTHSKETGPWGRWPMPEKEGVLLVLKRFINFNLSFAAGGNLLPSGGGRSFWDDEKRKDCDAFCLQAAGEAF